MSREREALRKQNLELLHHLKNDGTLEIYSILRGYVVHEDNLVNQRTTWFLSLNSFLFASQALVVSSRGDDLVHDEWQLSLFTVILALVGAVSSIVTFFAVSGAYASTKALKDLWVDKYEPLSKDFGASEQHRAIDDYDFEDIKKTRFRNDPTRPLPYLKGGGGAYGNAVKGRYLAFVMPCMIGAAWLIILGATLIT